MKLRHDDSVRSTVSNTTGGEPDVRPRVEQLHIRNYDETRRYHLAVSVSRPGYPPSHEATYELAPDNVLSELQVVPPGRYNVTVEGSFRPVENAPTDEPTGDDADTAVCNVGDRAPQTVVIECGNGVVSVSEGLSG
jgi:hypothetical protein